MLVLRLSSNRMVLLEQLMQFSFKVIGAATALVFSSNLLSAEGEGTFTPKLDRSSDYNEYWEQQFLFENNELLTSQFLITNLPLSRHHGIMLGSLKTPDNPSVIIKNGRGRDGWKFQEDGSSLSIFTHRIADRFSRYEMRLANTAAEVDVDFRTQVRAIELITPSDDVNLPRINLYVPLASGEGRWRMGPELTGDDSYDVWRDLKNGRGYALHVRQNAKPNSGLRKWYRLTSVAQGGDSANLPILHHFVTPEGREKTVLLLIQDEGIILRFDDVSFRQQAENDHWLISAQNDDYRVEGDVRYQDHLEQFDVADHLTGIEKLVAGSLASIQRKRSLVSYSLTVHHNGASSVSTGKALMEDISLGQEKESKRRRLRRR